MNIFEVIGTTAEGLTVSEMVEMKTLKEAIEYGHKWAKRENLMLKSVKQVYISTRRPNRNYNDIERNLTHKKKKRVVSKYKPSRRRSG